MRAYGVTLVEHGTDFEAAREEAARLAKKHGLEFAPSFAPDLVAGVASYAAELFAEAGALDAVYVPIGLGSGICGTMAVRDRLGLRTEIIGVRSTGADRYAQSLAAGHVVTLNRADTWADGVAVRQPDAEAFALIQQGVARIVTVTDDEIGAAPLAALLQERDRMRGKRVGVVLSGGGISISRFFSVGWVSRPLTYAYTSILLRLRLTRA